jgi:hypothetical protein
MAWYILFCSFCVMAWCILFCSVLTRFRIICTDRSTRSSDPGRLKSNFDARKKSKELSPEEMSTLFSISHLVSSPMAKAVAF